MLGQGPLSRTLIPALKPSGFFLVVMGIRSRDCFSKQDYLESDRWDQTRLGCRAAAVSRSNTLLSNADSKLRRMLFCPVRISCGGYAVSAHLILFPFLLQAVDEGGASATEREGG